MSPTTNTAGFDQVDRLFVDTIRLLSVDQVEAAKSGHPGLPMGLAPVAYTIFSRFLKFDPSWPEWPDRDRFVLSAGHGSALLYSLLHLYGYPLTIDDLKQFRQWGSLTPGHPEFGHTAGVEVTTGPLGQGLATSVGLALAERMAASRANIAGHAAIVDHHTFVLASDGDLMEGVSHEAASLAGHLGLGRLIVCFDNNDVTIDGPASQACSDDVLARFSSYGWHTASVGDGNDLESISRAISGAVEETDRPSLIAVKTTIGYGSPTRAGKSSAHGGHFGKDETAATKTFFGFSPDLSFYVPDQVKIRAAERIAIGHDLATKWKELAKKQKFETPTVSVSDDKLAKLIEFEPGSQLATRIASNQNLSVLMDEIDSLVGGSADLSESTGTKLAVKQISKGKYSGRVINYGIREHAMAACSNGIALHGGFRPFCSTFLVFSDYMRPSMRLSALMGLPVIYILTHDSIAVGEDGPTHQPVEHLAALRSIPNLAVIRPADANETSEAWRCALTRTDGPTALVLSRQALPTLDTAEAGWLSQTGARIVFGEENHDLTILATGSEVGLAIEAAKRLGEDHSLATRVVSVPWRERLLSLNTDHIETLAGRPDRRFVIEAGSPLGWDALVTGPNRIISISTFGSSAPGALVLEKYGFSVDQVVARVLDSKLNNEIPVDEDPSSPISLLPTLIRATVEAAVACQPYVGGGDKSAADLACVTAMRNSMAESTAEVTVAIGEGVKDKAPMLFEGEVLGTVGGQRFEIAVDPLEGTNYCAKGQDGAVSVVAAAESGSLYATAGFYMDKLVVPAKARGAIDIRLSATQNLTSIAAALDVEVSDLRVVVLSKPRHERLISEIRDTGAKVIEIPDGDVMASLKVMLPDSNIDVLMGIGGAPEGVITACAAKILGAGMQGRLAPQSDEERALLDQVEPEWSRRVLTAEDMVKGESVLVATAVTDSAPLRGPRKSPSGLTTQSVVIAQGRVTYVETMAGNPTHVERTGVN